VNFCVLIAAVTTSSFSLANCTFPEHRRVIPSLER